MKNIILLVSSFFFLFVIFQANASGEFPRNTQEFNIYLSKIDKNERIGTYNQIIENIDGLINETNISKSLSKIQKRKLIAQYRTFKNRTQLALKKEQKHIASNIDFHQIIQKKVTNTGTTNTGIIISNPATQQILPQQGTQQANPTISTSTSSVQASTSSSQTNNNTQQTNLQTTTTTTSYNPKIVIGSSAIATPDSRRINAGGFIEIGRFSISASDEDFQIKSIKISNLGNLQLSNLFTENPNIQLIDIERETPLWRIDCGDIIEGNNIFLQDCSIDTIRKGTKRNFKIVVYPQTIDSLLKKNIQLSINSADISLVRLSDSGSIETSKITGSVTMDSYVADYPPPNVIINKAGQYQLRVSISNSTNTTINLKSFEFELSQSTNANGQLLGNMCLIIPGSPNPCGSGNTETTNPIQIAVNSPITTTTFTLPALTYSNILDQNYQKEIYINISNDTLVSPFNIITAKIKSIQYSINGIDYNINTESWSSAKTTLN